MKAILELGHVPTNCFTCPLNRMDDDERNCRCQELHVSVDRYSEGYIRHPDCPLKVQPEGLRWINRGAYYECPSCSVGFTGAMNFSYCPSCGAKLDPPEEEK